MGWYEQIVKSIDLHWRCCWVALCVCVLAPVWSHAVDTLRSICGFMSRCWLPAAYKWRIPTSCWKLWSRSKSCQGSCRGTISSKGWWDPWLPSDIKWSNRSQSHARFGDVEALRLRSQFSVQIRRIAFWKSCRLQCEGHWSVWEAHVRRSPRGLDQIALVKKTCSNSSYMSWFTGDATGPSKTHQSGHPSFLYPCFWDLRKPVKQNELKFSFKWPRFVWLQFEVWDGAVFVLCLQSRWWSKLHVSKAAGKKTLLKLHVRGKRRPL